MEAKEDTTSQLRHHQTTFFDIENGPPNAPTTANVGGGVFAKLMETIRWNRYHLNDEKIAAYNDLMNNLDKVEEIHHLKFTFFIISLEILVLSGLTAALVCTVKLESMKHSLFLRVKMWQWVTMVLMFASGLSVVRFFTFLIFWPVKRWWRIHKYVVYFTRQLKGCVDVTLWFCIVLLGWYLWFRPKIKNVHGNLSVVISHQVTRFLMALCIGSFLWLLKNALYLKLEADLHYGQFFDRLKQSVLDLHGIQILHNRGTWKFLIDKESKKKLQRMAKSKKTNNKVAAVLEVDQNELIQYGNNIWMDVVKMEKVSVPIWILRRLAEEYLVQVKLRPVPWKGDLSLKDHKILREAHQLFHQLVNKTLPNSNKKIIIDPDQLSNQEVKRENLEGYELSIAEKDFIFRFRKKETEDDEEADDESCLQQPSSRASQPDIPIGYDEFVNWVVRAYKNCSGLERTLYSSETVFKKLNRLLCSFLLMVMLIIWLLLSEIVNTGQLALLFTPFVAASFVFGDSCKKMFDGLIFAFAMHPFDVGDRVIINNVQMRVTEMNILTSIFYKYDTGEDVIIPNSALTSTSIINLDITPDQSDIVQFDVDPQTPLEDVKDLEIKIKKLLDDNIEYSSNNKVVKSEIGKDGTKMTVYFKYLVSYLTAEKKAVHKSKILSMIMKLLKDTEMNKKVYPPSYKPYTVEINLNLLLKIKLENIEDLQAIILRGQGRDSKVLITELTKSRIKMGLYTGHLDNTNEEVKKIEVDKADTRPKIITIEKVKNPDDICNRLKLKGKKFVKDVKIDEHDNNGDGEVIGDEDHQSSSLEIEPSIGAKEIRGYN